MKRAKYLIAAAGSGKTFVAGAFLRRLLDAGWHKKNCVSPWPIIYVTRKKVVTQTRRVLETEFMIDTRNEVIVIGIDKLRTRFGEMFVREEMKVIDGEEHIKYIWTPMINPKLILWDEGHALKNHTSKQHKIALSYSELPGVTQIFMSATPAARVSEFKCFVTACGIKYNIPGLGEVVINDRTWNDFAKFIANGDQYEYNQAACDRLTDIMEPFIVRMKGIKSQFHAKNRTELIDFITKEGKQFYDEAEERFQRRKAKAEGRIAEGKGSKLEILVALMMRNIAAESNPDRIKIICDRMLEDAKNGFAPVCAMKQKISISKCLQYMFSKGVRREEISVIWGGAKQVLSKKAATAKAIGENTELQEALAAQGISMEGIGLDVDIIEEIKFDDSLRLNSPTDEDTQREIDRFQKGITKYCFFTMKTGGVGLSLHHTDQMVSRKCKRKESGYFLEEDIPNVPTKPRKLYSAPNYSAMDLVQVLGRCHRITSLSDTEQIIMFFRGTTEQDMAAICDNKLKCLSKVTRNRSDDWEQLIYNKEARDRYLRDAQIQAQQNPDDPDTLIDEGSDENGDEE